MQVTYTRPDKRITLADLSTRLMAELIDILLLLLVFATLDYFTFSSNEHALLLKPERLLHILLGWLYFAGAESCGGQATLGKYLLELQVKNNAGGRLSFYKASIRYFAKPLTLLALLRRLLPGAGLPPHHLLHDELAEAVVVPRR